MREATSTWQLACLAGLARAMAAVAVPALALANGYDVPNVNARDLAMAGATTADQIDAGAAWVLPAALPRVEGLSLSISGSILDNRTQWNAPTAAFSPGATASTRRNLVPPFEAFASYGFTVGEHRAGVGAGANIVGGGNMLWPEGWAGRTSVIEASVRDFAFYATGGVEVTPRLRLGGGLIYYRTTELLSQGLPLGLGTAQLATSGGAPSFDISAELEPLGGIPLTFAVDYKHQAVQKLTGRAHFDGVPPAFALVLQDQGVTHVVTRPNSLAAGASYRVLSGLSLDLGYRLSRYSVYKADEFDGEKPSPGAIMVPRDYHDGQTFRLGGEYRALKRLALRAGLERDISGMPKQRAANGGLGSPTYSPTLPDSNSWAGALGAGYSFASGLAVNTAFFYASMDEVSSTGAAFPGRYGTRVWIASLGVSYGWAPSRDAASARKL
jgi:long-chain fatty acid transport protein